MAAMPMVYDVIILGAGTMGVAAALAMARRGLVVLAIDRAAVPNAVGEHFGAARMFRTAYYEHPSYVPLLRRARELWLDLNRAAGRTLYHETGALYLGRAGSELMEGSERACRLHGLGHDRLSGAEVRRRFAGFSPPGGVEGLWEPSAGVLSPEASVAAMASLAREAGATIGTHEQVLEVEGGDEVTVRTDRARYVGRRAVVTLGAWTQKVLEASGAAGPEIRVTRQALGWMRPADAAGFGVGRHPCWAYEDEPGSLLYGFPVLPGDGDFRVARHRRGAACDPDTVERGVGAADVADFEPGVRGLIPGAGAVSRAAIAFYSNSVDGHFVIDRLPGSANVLVAAGFSGHGFKFAPVVGEVLADLAEGDRTAHDIGLFALGGRGPA